MNIEANDDQASLCAEWMTQQTERVSMSEISRSFIEIVNVTDWINNIEETLI